MRVHIDDSAWNRQLREALETRQMVDGAIRAIRETAADVQGDVVRSIQNSPPTGRVYRRNEPGLSDTHTASSPGNPPRSDSGRLVQSVRVEPSADGADIVVASDYAVHLEYGTRNMAPRPFLGPAIEAKADKLTDRVRETLRREWER